MRKLIETARKSLIVCDNHICNYEVAYTPEIENTFSQYINKPCPVCGENLLTEQDYLQDEKIMRSVQCINKWFSWITFFYSKKSWSNRQTLSVHVHDGVKIKNETGVV